MKALQSQMALLREENKGLSSRLATAEMQLSSLRRCETESEQSSEALLGQQRQAAVRQQQLEEENKALSSKNASLSAKVQELTFELEGKEKAIQKTSAGATSLEL
jgi:hypothetical protein